MVLAVQIIQIWKWKQNRMSDENLVILEFKYFQNKKWQKQAVNMAAQLFQLKTQKDRRKFITQLKHDILIK